MKLENTKGGNNEDLIVRGPFDERAQFLTCRDEEGFERVIIIMCWLLSICWILATAPVL